MIVLLLIDLHQIMGNNTELGKEGEKIAADYLIKKGYAVVARNYRYRRAEVDLIVRQDDLLVFVEVKMRKNAYFGYPEEAVGNDKIKRITSAAENYMSINNWQGRLRFDIISIINNQKLEIEHFEDAF